MSQARLLTYNTFLRPPLIHNNENDFKNERCHRIIDFLKDFDIICFQETFSFLNTRKEQLQKRAFKQGFIYQASSPDPGLFSGYLIDGGLLTLSKYPILAQEFQPFSFGILSDALAMKGVLYTKIQIGDNKIFHLFNSHLQASYMDSEDMTVATVVTRIYQLQSYRKFMTNILSKQKYHSNDLVLLAGDYNVNGLDKGYPKKVVEMFPELGICVNSKGLYDEYQGLIQIISNFQKDKILDLARTNNTGLPVVTFGDADNEDKPLEVVLTSKFEQGSKQSLDYLLLILPCHQEVRNWKIKSLKIEKFFIKSEKFTQLSDHYGLSCEII